MQISEIKPAIRRAEGYIQNVSRYGMSGPYGAYSASEADVLIADISRAGLPSIAADLAAQLATAQ